MIYDASLDELLQKVWDGKRINQAEALRLYHLPLEELGALADRALALDPNMVEALLHKAAAAKALGKTELVREASLTLAAIEAEKFQRSR